MSDTTPQGTPPQTPPPPPEAPPTPSAPTPPAYGAPQGYPGAQPPAYAPPQAYPAAPQQGYPAAPQPYGAAPQYAAAPPAYGGYPAPRKTNVLAIISMIASIAGAVWLLPLLGSLAGAIMGHVSLNQLKTSGEAGRGMALAGVIVGWVGLGLSILGIILFFSLVAWAAQQGARYGS